MSEDTTFEIEGLLFDLTDPEDVEALQELGYLDVDFSKKELQPS